MNRFIICLFVVVWLESCNAHGKRGPHHPRGQEIVSTKSVNLDSHLLHSDEHIKEDLKQFPLNEQDITQMSPEEKQFYEFKLHDNDNNDLLDGLEMLYSVSSHENSFQQRDSEMESHRFENEFEHIVDLIDNFMIHADLNDDGYLNYPEYAKAMQAQPINGGDSANNNIDVDEENEI